MVPSLAAGLILLLLVAVFVYNFERLRARASSACDLVSTEQIVELLGPGGVRYEKYRSECLWFTPDANRHASLAVHVYATPAEASASFKSQELFTPGQHPFDFGDGAYSSFLTGHSAAVALVGPAVVIAVFNGMDRPNDDAVAAAQKVVEAAGARVRQGWRP